jgi:hypothetical protein
MARFWGRATGRKVIISDTDHYAPAPRRGDHAGPENPFCDDHHSIQLNFGSSAASTARPAAVVQAVLPLLQGLHALGVVLLRE